MSNPTPINLALERLAELNGKPAELEGILAAEGEGYHLVHFPKAERKIVHTEGPLTYQPGVFLEFGNGSIQANHSVLNRWLGKRVRVHGLIRTRLLPKEYASMDILGMLWPASIAPYSIQRLTAEERREHHG